MKRYELVIRTYLLVQEPIKLLFSRAGHRVPALRGISDFKSFFESQRNPLEIRMEMEPHFGPNPVIRSCLLHLALAIRVVPSCWGDATSQIF
jgi:hypothetical protein